MKKIKLTQSQFALVDNDDYDILSSIKWHATKTKHTYYAKWNYWEGDRCVTVSMHRYILNINDPNILVDHKDHNGLNNQRNNLRRATYKQNTYNTKSRKNSSSKYLGVSWKVRLNKWQVLIQKDGECTYVGVFSDEKEAAIAYNYEAKILFGEFANLNQV